jgi:hypothetical protein
MDWASTTVFGIHLVEFFKGAAVFTPVFPDITGHVRVWLYRDIQGRPVLEQWACCLVYEEGLWRNEVYCPIIGGVTSGDGGKFGGGEGLSAGLQESHRLLGILIVAQLNKAYPRRSPYYLL